MSADLYTEDVVIEQPAIAPFGGDLLLPKLISDEVDVSELDIEASETRHGM